MLEATETSVDQPLLSPFEVCLTNTSLSVRQALNDVLEALCPLGLDVEECATIELVLAEVLNNVVEHAYEESQHDAIIRVMGEQRPNGLHLRVVDLGRQVSEEAQLFRSAPDVDCAISDLPEGGFGWFLIRDLAKDVKYQRRGEENHLTLRLAIATDKVN